MRRMCWHSKSEEQAKILWVEETTRGWVPYNQSSLAVPDYRIASGSKGYATMQKLFKLDWKIVNEKEMLSITPSFRTELERATLKYIDQPKF